LHLREGLLLLFLIGEANETVSTRHAANGVRHDLGGLARLELVLKQLDKNELVDLGAEITDENRELGAAVIATVAELLVLSNRYKSDEVTHLRSARPPPDAQLSLKGRLELGISCPLRVRALAAAAAFAKSTKQYPALLLPSD
jgi:hypothetical protein